MPTEMSAISSKPSTNIVRMFTHIFRTIHSVAFVLILISIEFFCQCIVGILFQCCRQTLYFHLQSHSYSHSHLRIWWHKKRRHTLWILCSQPLLINYSKLCTYLSIFLCRYMDEYRCMCDGVERAYSYLEIILLRTNKRKTTENETKDKIQNTIQYMKL